MYSTKLNGEHRLEILGIGTTKDKALRINVEHALEQLNLDLPIQEVQNIDEMLISGIKAIPALLLDGNVIFQEIVPTVEEIREALLARLVLA